MKRKINILAAVTALTVILSLLWSVNNTEASIGYNLGKNDYYFESGSKWVNIYCSNGQGKNDGSFSLVVTFHNATFSAATEQQYQKVDNSTVKFFFTLRGGEQASKQVFFTINQHVAGFSIELTLEKQSLIMNTISYYSINLRYIWNMTQQEYTLIQAS